MKQYVLKGVNRHIVERVSGSAFFAVSAEGGESMTVSDGYHTMDDLYEHRHRLFIALCRKQVEEDFYRSAISSVWRSKRHSVDTEGREEAMFEGMFILGIGKERGSQITFHLPIELWNETGFAETLLNAPQWDGHTSSEVLERLKVI